MHQELLNLVVVLRDFVFISSGNDEEARKDEKEEERNEMTSTAAMFRGET